MAPGPGLGVQVWLDPARAGRSALVVEESELDGPPPGGGARVLVATGPDGDPIVFTGR